MNYAEHREGRGERKGLSSFSLLLRKKLLKDSHLPLLLREEDVKIILNDSFCINVPTTNFIYVIAPQLQVHKSSAYCKSVRVRTSTKVTVNNSIKPNKSYDVRRSGDESKSTTKFWNFIFLPKRGNKIAETWDDII